MRVRPFFWIFLATVCTGVLIFAATISAYRSVPMRAHIDQISTVATDATFVRLRLTDPEGLPIDQASIIPSAYMLEMNMGPQQASVRSLGQGVYLAQIQFSMAGAWKVDIVARADGFETMQQSIQINI